MSNLLGDYELLEQIGYGATGRVWRARHVGTNALVAVKELRGDLADDPEVRTRFLNEGAVLAGRKLAGVVQVHGAVLDGDRVGLVMDLIQGYDLRQLISGEGPLPPGRACALAGQVAEALATAHEGGLVHRDVKPENVMVVDSGSGPGTALLTDFGLARVLDETGSTRTRSQAFGTPHYVAPEVLRGGRAEGPADVYALAVVLFETVMGWRPFRFQHPAALMEQHLHQSPSRPPELSDGVWAVIKRCLEKDPSERPTARALSGELEALADQLADAPALPRTDPPTEQEMTQVKEPIEPAGVISPRTGRFGDRTPRLVGAGIAALVAVALIAFGASGAATDATDPATAAGSAVTTPSETNAPTPAAADSSPHPSPTTARTATPTPGDDKKPKNKTNGTEPDNKSGDSSKSTTKSGDRSKSTTESGSNTTKSGNTSKSTNKNGSNTTKSGNTSKSTNRNGKTTTRKANPNDTFYGVCQTKVPSETLKSSYPTYKWSRCQIGSSNQVYKLFKQPTGQAKTKILLYNRNFVYYSGFKQRQWSVAPASWSSWLRKAGWGGNNGEDEPVLLGYGSTTRWSSSVSVQTWLKDGGRDSRNHRLHSWLSIADGRNLSSAGYRREWNQFYVPGR